MKEERMIYTLEKDGDSYEIRYWELLRNDFPNYEVFWSRFIVPLTKRAERKEMGLKEDIDPLLESMAMVHYTVFYHLGVAPDFQARLGQEFSEDILFHLSSATEMIERLVFILAKLNTALRSAELPSELTEQNVSETTLEYLSSKSYSKEFKRFLSRGQSVNIRLHNIDDMTIPFMRNISDQAARDFDDWQDIAQQIRHYRNTLAHNPRLGMLLRDQEKIFVPKESELHKYELWSSVTKRSDNKDFVLLSDLLSNFQASLVEKTNSLWAYLIAFMDEISKTEGYVQLAGTNSKIIFVDDSQPVQPIFPPPSGSSSYDPTN